MQINQNSLEAILNDLSMGEELEAMLNGMIDEELAKPDDEMDFELIDECADMLLELEQEQGDGVAIIVPLISSEKIMAKCRKNGFKNLSRGVQAGLVASIILLTGVTANAAIYKISGVNVISEMAQAVSDKLDQWGIITADKQEELTEPTTLPEEKNESVTKPQKENEETTTTPNTPTTTTVNKENSNNTENNQTTTQKKQEYKVTPPEIENTTSPQEPAQKPGITPADTNNEDKPAEPEEKGNVVAIRLSFSNSFKTEYLWGESLDLTGLTVTAVYDGGATENISTSLCTFEGYNKAKEGSQKIVVTYEGASATFDITLKRTTQKTDKVATGFKATLPDKLVYTTRDVNVDLTGIDVKITYSDGSVSSGYSSASMRVISSPDFSILGEQEVTVLIAEKYEYTFKITVVEYEGFQGIIALEYYPGILDCSFYVGEEPDLENYCFTAWTSYTQVKSENISFDDPEVTITGIDTTEESVDGSKKLTIYYKGLTLTYPYTVSLRTNLIRNAEICTEYDRYNVREERKYYKCLYYISEDLTVGKNRHSNSISSLSSCTAIPRVYEKRMDEKLTCYYKNLDFKVRIYWLSGKAEEVPINDCDIYGYDPYTLGFQTLDIYYNDTYLTSYVVFVYGEEGIVPDSNAFPSAYVVRGNEQYLGIPKKTSVQSFATSWRKAIGNTEISYNIVGECESKLFFRSTDSGWQTGYIQDYQGSLHEYTACQVYNIDSYEIKFAKSFVPKFNITDIDNIDYGNGTVTFKLSDGTACKELLRNCKIVYLVSNSMLTSESRIKSVVAVMNVIPDRNKYYGANPINSAYIYSDGFENSFSLDFCDLTDTTKTLFPTGHDFANTKFCIKAMSNDGPWFYGKEVTADNIDVNSAGIYNAEFSVKKDKIDFSFTREIQIADELFEEYIEVIKDPNKDRGLIENEELTYEGLEIEYHNPFGEVITITEADISYEILACGTGHTVSETREEESVWVLITYNSPYGKTLECYADYKFWCYVTDLKLKKASLDDGSTDYEFFWKGTPQVDYYKVAIAKSYGDTDKYECVVSDPYVFVNTKTLIDKGVVRFGYISITPVRLDENGNEIEGEAFEKHRIFIQEITS